MQLPSYLQPTLVGYSSGATLVYAALAQAPRGTFAGAVSLGFCPDLQMPATPCRGSGLAFSRGHRGELVFQPSAELAQPWILLQGEKDEVCDATKTAAFAADVPGARVVRLPLVGHGFSVEPRWLPQFRSAYRDVSGTGGPARARIAGANGLGDLPLSEVPARQGGDTLALLITGDGGWAALDQNVSAELARRGVSVVGLSSLKYFWRRRTPELAAQDIAQVLRHYSSTWHRSRIALIGYSFGADVLPFIVNRLPGDVRARLISVNLLGLSSSADFEISLGEVIGRPAVSMSVAPEVARMRDVPVLCIFGDGEKESLCPSLPAGTVTSVRIGAGHHFSGESAALAEQIARFAARKGSPSRS